MLERIVVPLDGSPFAEQALPLAFDLAKRAAPSGRVDLVTVHEPVPDAQGTPVLDPRFEQALREGMLERLSILAEKWSDTGVLAGTHILIGPVADTIAGWVKEQHTHLVVMTSHGRGGLSRFWLGSTAEALVRRCDIPVLLLRPAEGAGPIRLLEPRRILIPLDGSGFGEEALDRAVEFAGTDGIEYILVQVVAPMPAVLSVATTTGHDEKAHEGREAVAADYLEFQETRLQNLGAKARKVVLTHENVARALIDFAEDQTIDLIAMVTHGRGEFSRALFGSVADKILRGSRVPVLLARTPKR